MKNKKMILGIAIVVLVIIIGVVIYIVANSKKGPKDSSEIIPSDVVSTPNDNTGDNTQGYVMTK